MAELHVDQCDEEVIYGNEASYLDEEEIIYVSSAEEDEGEKDSALE